MTAPNDLAAYQADFPGHETEIAAAWQRLQALDEGSAQPHQTLRKLGPLRLVREIARGGQGVVFLAEDSRFRRIVAVKALLPGPAGAWSEVAVQRLRRDSASPGTRTKSAQRSPPPAIWSARCRTWHPSKCRPGRSIDEPMSMPSASRCSNA